MSESVMLVLIGGRSAVPAIAGALQFLDKVDRVKFLLCDGNDYPTFQENVEKVLKQEQRNLRCDKNTDVKIVNPNKFDDVYKAVDELCKGVKDLKYVNLTTAPQIMAFSVYSYVLKEYKEALVFNVNTDISQINPLVFGKEPTSFNKPLSVENYLAMYGLNIFKKNTGKNEADSVAQYFGKKVNISSQILSIIRSDAKGADSIKAPRGFNLTRDKFKKLEVLDNDLETFFEMLAKAEIIQNLQQSEREIKFKIQTNENYAFLAGEWLELYVYLSASECKFDSVEMGVELDNYNGQLDVFCLNNANAMICECKTGGFKSENLSKLNSQAEKLGGNYCVKLFITSDVKVSEKFLNKAKNDKIVVVSGDKFSDLTNILKKEMEKPTYPRR
ncbi:Card1-like endonuclease domain-containing protein [Microcoleus sp.]|uniref:Card1-like endonuclease domain-containing protein n=1 Tax=Microcoleus sp. TaxID=44472 RepID=UPI00403E7661